MRDSADAELTSVLAYGAVAAVGAAVTRLHPVVWPNHHKVRLW